MKLVTLGQVIAFLDAVYLPENSNNTEAYEPISISMNDFLVLLWQHTYLMSDSTVISFSRWCSTSKIDIMTILPKRKLVETGQKISTRPIFALKPVYIEGVIRCVVTLLPKYQEYIKGLRKNGHTIIGYIRKSKPKIEDRASRVKLLQRMSNKLRQKSLVQKVFASTSANASDSLLTRDLVKNDLLEKLEADGDMLDMLEYISCNEKVVLITLDYAGLTTKPNGLQNNFKYFQNRSG